MKRTKIEINKLTPEKVEVGFLKRIAEKASKLVKLKIPELSIVLICDRRMKGLNKKFRKQNRITDVLAFDYGLPFGGQGEIIICLPQTRRQAKQLKHSLKEELSILLIHGILHLAGYKDETKKDFNKTLNRQKEIWRKIKS